MPYALREYAMSANFSNSELEAFLDESLPVERMAAIEEALCAAAMSCRSSLRRSTAGATRASTRSAKSGGAIG